MLTVNGRGSHATAVVTSLNHVVPIILIAQIDAAQATGSAPSCRAGEKE